jgi:4-diphosphocytidyl-2-C-methyl-D-erythritol kinase
MISYPNAKINLGLHVINKRDDGFHNIETIFYPINFSDMLECIENKAYAKNNKCVFVQHGLHISGNIDTNLVVRAYKLLDKEFDFKVIEVVNPEGLEIHTYLKDFISGVKFIKEDDE